MSKHWQPPAGKIVRIRPVGDWTRIQSYWRVHRSLPAGGKAGLIVVAASCVMLAMLAYQLLGPRDIVADEVTAPQAVESASSTS